MADISNINLPNGENYDIKDKVARNDITLNRTTLGTQCKNLLNETEYLSSIKTATNGTLSKSGNSITLTATSNDCYTAPFFANDNGYRIPVSPNTTYILSWESDNSNYGIIHVFMNGIVSKQQAANNSVTKYLKFTTDIDATFITIRFSVRNSGDSITYSNIMLRDADITDDTYEPYKENINERLIKNKSDIAVNKTTLGYQSKNLLKLTLTTKTVSGITFTVNDDYSITLNGTSTAIIWQEIGATGGNNFRKEKLIFTGNPAGTGGGAGLEAWYMNSTTGNKYVSIANGNILTESDYDPSGAISYEFHINQGKTYNNVTFYPMLRYADITDDTYEPYQPSLKEQVPYSISLPSKSTSESYSYNGVPTMICLTPSESVSSGGGLYLINSVGTAVYLIDKTGIVINTDTTNKTFTITNNTASTYDVYISCAYKKE